MSQPLLFIRADTIKESAKINVTSYSPLFVMTCSMCGVRELDISCSAHIVTRGQASDSQMAKQQVYSCYSNWLDDKKNHDAHSILEKIDHKKCVLP